MEISSTVSALPNSKASRSSVYLQGPLSEDQWNVAVMEVGGRAPVRFILQENREALMTFV